MGTGSCRFQDSAWSATRLSSPACGARGAGPSGQIAKDKVDHFRLRHFARLEQQPAWTEFKEIETDLVGAGQLFCEKTGPPAIIRTLDGRAVPPAGIVSFSVPGRYGRLGDVEIPLNQACGLRSIAPVSTPSARISAIGPAE